MLTQADIDYIIDTPEADIDPDTISDYDLRQDEFGHLTLKEVQAKYKKEALDSQMVVLDVISTGEQVYRFDPYPKPVPANRSMMGTAVKTLK